MTEASQAGEWGGCRILERLGQGGMGVVYKAHHRRLDRIVALKVLAPQLVRQLDFVAAFVQEARAAARLEHPNIVQVYDAGKEKGAYFIVMQFVEGETAMDRIQKTKRIAPVEALRILHSALEGLGAAHQQGFIHRDVKPGNILIAKDGAIRLSDFGLVTWASDAGKGGGLNMGSPHYLAPELGWGGAVDARSDIYAMGATYFHMLAGEPPFNGANAADTISMHMNNPLPDIRAINPDVSNLAATVIAKMMAKNPAQRYSSVEAVLKDLNSPGMLLEDAAACEGEATIDLGIRAKRKMAQWSTDPTGFAAQAMSVPEPEPEHVQVTENKSGWRAAAGLGLSAVAVICAYLAGTTGNLALLLAAGAALFAGVFLERSLASFSTLTYFICSIALLFIAGRFPMREGVFWREHGWKAHLAPLSLALGWLAALPSLKLRAQRFDSVKTAAALLAMTLCLYSFALPWNQPLVPSHGLAGQALYLAAIAGALGSLTIIFSRSQRMRAIGSTLAIPLVAGAGLSAYLCGAMQTGKINSWRALFQAPFYLYPQRFMRYAGPLTWGILLYILGLGLAIYHCRSHPQNLGDELPLG